jgi:hypothetical protein
MTKSLLLISFLITCVACLGETKVYKIVDPAGRVTYTDAPPAENGANQLQLPPINQLPASKPTEISLSAADTEVFAGYSVIDLVAPLDNSLIHYDQQNIVVQLALTPELQQGHYVQFYLDGGAYKKPVTATTYAIGDLQRGSHSVSARVVTAEGETVASSQSVRVHVQRHFRRK